MKIIKITFIGLLIFLTDSLIWANTNIPKKEFFVTTKGNDKNDGTKEKPFASIQAARDAIRKIKGINEYPKGGITVWIGGGVYELTTRFDLAEQDSGTEDAPVIYTSIKGELPRFVGGIRIPANKFMAVSDINFLKNLVDKSVQSHILQVNLKDLGLTDYGKINDLHAVDFGSDTHYLPAPMEVFVDQQPMSLSRWPNRNNDIPFMGNVDRAKIQMVNDEQGKPKQYSVLNVNDVLCHKNASTEDGDLSGISPKMAFGHLKLWTTKEDVMVGGCLVRGYAHTARKIASIDSNKGTFTFQNSVNLWPTYNQEEASMIYFYNLPEEIDIPGEYYINRNTGILYLYPPKDFNSNSEVVVSTLNDVLISIENCSHIRLKGLTFEVTRTSAVFISGGKDNVLESCTLRNTGIVGVQIGKGYDSKTQKLISRLPGDYRNALCTGLEVGGPIQSATKTHPRTGTSLNREGGEKNGLDGCIIYNTGIGGVLLGGGDRKTLTPANNFVKNCNIYRTDRLITYYAENITVDGCGNHIEANYLHDNLGGILYIHGNDHIIEYNEICRGITGSVDGGAIEIRQNPSQLGNVLRFNYIHDNARDFNSHTRAIYLDNETCGIQIFGNVFYRNKGRFGMLGNTTGVIFINGGYENKIHNNLFVGNFGSDIIDGHEFKKMRSTMIYARGFMMEKDVDITKPPYSTRYPEMSKIFTGFKANDSTIVIANHVYDNVFVGNGGKKLSEGRYPDKKFRYNNIEFDVMQQVDFVDDNKNNFELKLSSPIFKQIPGFAPIPFKKMNQAIRWENK
ncbi:MAG: hypothetical protein GZ091_08270 [Paludibacter sp.]|nr:hypothetical protein [Paludibacter sp.]